MTLDEAISSSENPNNCEMRDATFEERESIDKYIKSISKPTGVKFGALEQEPSGDCISRQAVLDEAFEVDTKEYGRIEVVGVDAIDALPSVKPQTGHWILLDECSNSGYYCSECQKKVVKEGWSNTVKKIKYCPNCGARMESEKNE